MKIERVDAFYLRLPQVRDVGDGSQDALLIRIQAGGFEGWGECEASPLPTIAALVAPMSHSACKPVLDSVIGANVTGPASIAAIHRAVRENSQDLLQTDHALSGIDIALWDLLGKREQSPIWGFYGNENLPRTAYASQLFGDTPEETYDRARQVVASNYRAAKFGWGPIGRGTLAQDADQIQAARAGLGFDRDLMIDTGCVFGHDVDEAKKRLPAMEEADVVWWEEPFATGALREYASLASHTNISLAGGEGCHTVDQAKHFIDYGSVNFIQIDAGRIGGISAAREVAEYASEQGVRYVNHTFTSSLALSASLQPFADASEGGFAEVPISPSALAVAIAGPVWPLDAFGQVRAPSDPGLGIQVDIEAIRPYLQDVEMVWNGKVIWKSPPL